MAHDSEGVCDICGSSGLVGDTCLCGGVYHDLNVGVEEDKLDDDADTYPKSALKDDDVISLDEVEKIESASQGEDSIE